MSDWRRTRFVSEIPRVRQMRVKARVRRGESKILDLIRDWTSERKGENGEGEKRERGGQENKGGQV